MRKIYNFLTRLSVCLALMMIGSSSEARAGYLYVLSQQNGAANQIYCFLVDETTGSLFTVAGFPVATGGNGTTGTQSELLTIDRLNKRLYVINKGSNTVSAFDVNTSTGGLTPTAFSPFTVVTNANTIAVHPSGSPVVIGGNTGTGFSAVYRADSFDVTSTTVTQAAGSPFNTGGARPFSSAFSRDGSLYFTGGALSLNFAGFGVDPATGVLATLAGSPYGGFGVTGIRAYATDSQGRLFSTASGDGGIRIFTTTGGVTTGVSGNPFGTGFATITDGVLSPDEQFYVLIDSSTSQVASYRINGTGAATTVTGVGLAPSNGFSLNTVVFNEAGTFLFAANSSSRSVSRYRFNTATGAVSLLGTQAQNSIGTTGFLAGMDYMPTLAPTASGVRIAGRVVSADGQGLAKVSVTLTNPAGVERQVLTNPFGYFSFEEVEVGATYVLNASSKAVVFVPQTINVSEDLTELVISTALRKN